MITIDFGNVCEELTSKNVTLLFSVNVRGVNTTMLVKDANNQLYKIETCYHASYLDKLIKDKAIVTFLPLTNDQKENAKKLRLKEVSKDYLTQTMGKLNWKENKELVERTEAIEEREAIGEINEDEKDILLDELWAEYYQE